MNIHAPRGKKVLYLDENGHDWQKDDCRKLGLKKGDILTVAFTIVHGSSTEVFFEEYKNESFNSVMFEDLE